MAGAHPLLEKAEKQIQNIHAVRKKQLDELAEAISKSSSPELIFICTHNSRRSHFAQVAMALASEKYGLGIKTFSGGTESTALNSNALSAMRAAGVQIEDSVDLPESNTSENRSYLIHTEGMAHELFSKKYNHSLNPQEDFIAVMVCSDADENCPYVPGAAKRFSLPYDDPKESDGSGNEKEVYGERLLQITSEMLYVAERVGN